MSPQALAAALSPGFARPAVEAQAVFRAVMWAFARPGRVTRLVAHLDPPAPLSPEMAAITLALADYETPIWLDPVLFRQPEIGAWLRFHTGAPLVTDPGAARFALIGNPLKCPDFSVFAQGSPDYPDASATLILDIFRFEARGLSLEGPGVKGVQGFGATPLPENFTARWAANRAQFPRAVDLVLAGAGCVAALPRSVAVREG